MDTYGSQPQPVYVDRTNGLAIAGLVLSVLGLFVSGILSPIGLILSLIALGKPVGKGVAWAGIIVGVLGLCGWAIAWIIGGVALLAAVLAVFGVLLLSQREQLELTADMGTIAVQVEQYKESHDDIPPASLEVLGLGRSTRLDPWGTEYRYVLNIEAAGGFDIISNGPDGSPETEDDVYMSRSIRTGRMRCVNSNETWRRSSAAKTRRSSTRRTAMIPLMMAGARGMRDLRESRHHSGKRCSSSCLRGTSESRSRSMELSTSGSIR